MLKNLLPMLIAISLLGCATSPTGRSQLLMMSDSEMDQMGAQSFADLKKKLPIEKNRAINAYVRCVATSITNEIGGNWEVVVF